MQFLITNLVGPVDITCRYRGSCWERRQPYSYLLRFSQALGTIQKDDLDFNAVKPGLIFQAVLLRLPDVTEPTEGTSGFVKACLDVSMGTIVVTYAASEISEVFNALQRFFIERDWECCWRIDIHHLGLFLFDVQTSSLCDITLADWIFSWRWL